MKKQPLVTVTIKAPGIDISERVPRLVALQIAAYMDQVRPKKAAEESTNLLV